MLKWAMVFAVAGFVGAGVFYSPYLGIDGQTQLVCPLCPHVTMVGVSPLVRFIRLTLGGGILNAASFMLVGCTVVAIARRLKKTENQTMATPEHKLTGKSADEPAEQPASNGGAEQPRAGSGDERAAASAKPVQAAPGVEQLESTATSEQTARGAELTASPAEAEQDRDLQSARAPGDPEKLDASPAPKQAGSSAELSTTESNADASASRGDDEATDSLPETADASDVELFTTGSGAQHSATLSEEARPAGGARQPEASGVSEQAGSGAERSATRSSVELAATGSGVERSASSTESRGEGGGYKVHIPMYEGPLDLLLDLIKQQKMSIHDIRISEITAQYLDYLHKLEELDVDVSAEFIYMAATLIYIKSKMLLPPDPLASPEEQSADPRAELVQRLVEHEKFKNAAQLLYQKQQIEENVWSKPDKTLYQDPGTEGELVVSLVDLVKVFQQVLERRKEIVRIELHHEQFTVAQMIVQLRAQIISSVENAVNLIPFFEACPSRHAMIVAFLAVLEMVKLQAVALVQEAMFGDILVKKGRAFDVVFDENGAIRMVDEEYR